MTSPSAAVLAGVTPRLRLCEIPLGFAAQSYWLIEARAASRTGRPICVGEQLCRESSIATRATCAPANYVIERDGWSEQQRRKPYRMFSNLRHEPSRPNQHHCNPCIGEVAAKLTAPINYILGRHATAAYAFEFECGSLLHYRHRRANSFTHF